MFRSIHLALLVCALLAGSLFNGCSSSRSVRAKSESASRLLEVANNLVGTPYCKAGASTECFDCSGFVSYCFSNVGIVLPRKASEMYGAGSSVAKQGLVEGDLVFFRTTGKEITHVGIMLNNEEFVHSSTSRGVMISPLTDAYWAPRYVGARRVLRD